MKENTRKAINNSATDGKLLPAFVMFMLPLMASACLMQSYVIVDGLILGNAIGEAAIGSVNSVGPIIDACTLVQVALAGGTAIIASHLFGAEKYAELNKLMDDMSRLLILISLAVVGIVFVGAPAFLRLVNTPERLFDGALTYLRIVFMGVPFTALYNLQSGALRGMGDSRKPLGGMAVSSGVNIGLDLIFVVVFRFGIVGAAVATVASQILSVVYLRRKLNEKRRAFAAESDAVPASQVRECINLSVPQMIQSIANSTGNILLQNITNLLGAAVVIGVSVAFKVDSILVIPLMCLGQATAVFTGQNMGAGKPDRVKGTLKISIIMSLCITAVMAVALWLLGYPLLELFNLGKSAADVGYRYIMVCMPFYWIFGLQFVFNGYLNGAKHTLVTSMASIAGLAGRVALAYFAWKGLGADVLPYGEALSWAVVVVIDVVFLMSKRGKNM